MNRTVMKIVMIGMLLFSLVGCKSHSLSSSQVDRSRYAGARWLSWNSTEQENFAFGYIDGYRTGTHDACEAADKLFDIKGPVPEHDKDEIPVPSGLCLRSADDYSKGRWDAMKGADVSAYTSAVTAFYSKHPEYQNIPFEYLLQYMTDKHHKTDEDLYRMAKDGEIRTSW